MELANAAGLKTYVRPLTVGDVDSCVRVESTFPPQERCSPEKVRCAVDHSDTAKLTMPVDSSSIA
jgi:hypothetical protein